MLSEGDVDAPRVGTFLLTVKAPIGHHHWNRLEFLAVVGAHTVLLYASMMSSSQVSCALALMSSSPIGRVVLVRTSNM